MAGCCRHLTFLLLAAFFGGEKNVYLKPTFIINLAVVSDIFVLPLYTCIYIAYGIQYKTIVFIACLARIPLIERHAIQNTRQHPLVE